MKWLDTIARRLGYVRPSRARNFGAAEVSRLTASLSTETSEINNTLRRQLRVLRARSRQVTQNNPYARRFAAMVVDNVCGPVPFKLQAKAKFRSGKLDTSANSKIESCWKSWGKKGHCEITGRMSWNAMQRLAVRTLAVDGEVLIRIHRGAQYGPHGYQLQLLDTDRLDDLKNEALPGGGAIHMGVELDPMSRPIRYHLLRRKPAHYQSGYTPREHEVIDASDIIHYFIPDFAEQVRGVPWIYAALLNLVHTGAFAEAAVIAARVGATQMGVIESPDGNGAALANGATADGTPQIDAEPGTFPVLPQGYKLTGWNPKYPDAAIEPFLKACLRGIACGVNVAYHNLSGDMEGVNYSSARIAELDERDSWMTIQAAIVEHLHDPLAVDWMRMQVLVGKLPFDPSRMDAYQDFYFQPRRWAWVDPAKEVTAALDAINGRLKSRTRVVAESGEDFEDVLDEIAQEEQLAKDKKVSLGQQQPAAAAPASDPAEDESTDDDTGPPPPQEKHEVHITFQKDAISTTVAPAQFTLNVPPAQITNKVDVAAPEVKAAFNVPAPQVVVNNLPAPETEQTITRDANGDIKRITTRKAQGG